MQFYVFAKCFCHQSKKGMCQMNQTHQSETQRLFNLLQECFNKEELELMCFKLNIDYDNIAGDTKAVKFKELLIQLSRVGRMDDLFDYLQKHRPSNDWPDPESIIIGGYLTSEASEELAALDLYRRKLSGQKAQRIIGTIAFKPQNSIPLGDNTYIIRDITVRKNVGDLIINAARASDLTLNRNVGICLIESQSKTNQSKAFLNEKFRRAQLKQQALSDTRYLPQIYNIINKTPDFIWLIQQWLTGQSLTTYFSKDKPLPNQGKISQLLSWIANICEAVAALHKRKLSPAVICNDTIVISSRPRGAFLIDPMFSGQPELASDNFPKFDKIEDIQQIAKVIYNTTTHKTDFTQPPSTFNSAIPHQLDKILLDALQGNISNAYTLKRNLLKIKQEI